MTGLGTLLEIGVGHGAFLNAAREAGWNIIGVDVSHYAAEYVRRTYGITVHRGLLSDVGVPPGSIDVVHMSHVLEHLADPISILQTIRHVLRPGGVLAIEVPNELDSLLVRLRDSVGLLRPYQVPSTHLLFFTPKTLVETVRRAGYGIRTCRTLRDLAEGSAVRRSAKVIASLIERSLGMAPLIELIAQKNPPFTPMG
jgi:2-polyprenyl-3-methyl-5-hydroxy-6-metoxy-1,4-benzoquinol methylase